MSFSAGLYPPLVATARRYARRADEAEDIVQEVLIAALRAGRSDLSRAENRRWLNGAIRRRAAFDARSAIRRKKREHLVSAAGIESMPAPETQTLADLLEGLPNALRVVAALTLSGHSRAEIAHLLGLTDTALRQRIHGLKRAFAAHDRTLPTDTPGLAGTLAYGPLRQGLGRLLAQRGGHFASHDPDGHPIIFRTRSQKP